MFNFYNHVEFFLQIKYVSGSYDSGEGFELLNNAISEYETSKNNESGSYHRLFYLALPPSVYPSVCKMIRSYCMNPCKYSQKVSLQLNFPVINDAKANNYIARCRNKYLKNQ
jgi:glucose-6-phosphate 1-dehydrogenase